MRLRHPSHQDLQRWLDGNEPSIDSHIAGCSRCATIIEELADATDQSITDALASVYRPPEDLSERLERRVSERLDSRAVLDVVGDLFGAAFETSMLLLTEEPSHE